MILFKVWRLNDEGLGKIIVLTDMWWTTEAVKAVTPIYPANTAMEVIPLIRALNANAGSLRVMIIR